MTRYAKDTSVSQEKSRTEIERVLQRYGADQFAYGWSESGAMLGFRFNGRMVKFDLPMPEKADFQFTPDRGFERAPAQVEKLWEQAGRQRWRALVLVIKAKLEAVESGITTFENEFLAHTVLPDGTTVGMWANEQLDGILSSGKMPKLLPSLAGGRKR